MTHGIAAAVSNTGTRGTALVLFYGELLTAMVELRWMVLSLVIMVIADFRFGWGESSKRYAEAISVNNKTLAAQYRWRTSRAVRRSINKFVDYLIWLAVGVVIGYATLEPFGIPHIYGGAAAMTIAWGCELKSILSHFLYLRGIMASENSIGAFFKRFAIAFLKRKNEDVGGALEDSLNNEQNTDKMQ